MLRKTQIKKAVVVGGGGREGKKLHQSWSGQTGQQPRQQNGDDDIRMLSKSEKGEIWKIETIFFFSEGEKGEKMYKLINNGQLPLIKKQQPLSFHQKNNMKSYFLIAAATASKVNYWFLNKKLPSWAYHHH